MLFDPRAHEPLVEADWSPARVEAEIRAIARDADEALRPAGPGRPAGRAGLGRSAGPAGLARPKEPARAARDWWAIHPLDSEPGDPPVFHGIYLGAAGVLWALHHLACVGLHEPGHDYAQLAADALASYECRPEFGGPAASLWMGEAGIALVAWLLASTPGGADRIATIVEAEPADDTLELMWGSPGLLLAADAMLERTGEQRWAGAWKTIAGRLMSQWPAEAAGVWTQRLYGKAKQYLGPAHGMAGIVAALARRPDLVAPGELGPRATAAVSATVQREGKHANWPPSAGEPLAKADRGIRTQWCHGAPGIVASLAGLPRADELDELLQAGGELSWTAGPLSKGANLCHGTAGNGFALLKLFTRTQDESWLDRARRFAMHSAAQTKAARAKDGRGRYSLWTGDLGTAAYLRECLNATSQMPTIDRW